MHRWTWIAAIVLAVAPAAYPSDQIRIAEIGLEGYHHQGIPTRLSVLLLHADPQPATVDLRIHVHTYVQGRVDRVDTFSQPVTLAPNDQRITEIPILLRYTDRANIQVQEIDAHGNVLSEDTQPLEPPVPGYLIAILCAQPEVCHSAQSQITFSGTSAEQTDKNKLLQFATVLDPAGHFWGYSAASTVVLARPLAGMSTDQRQALEDYVREGYTLIVLQDQLSDADFLSAYRPPGNSGGVSAIGEGSIFWIPSLAGKQLGELYSGPDLELAVRGWQGDRSVKDQLSWARRRLSVQFHFPTLGWLLLWLAAYILVAGVGNFVLLRKLDRREWGWITLPCISIAFAFAMYVSSASGRPRDLRAEDVALYWMDEKSPVAFVERGERVSSNRRQDLTFRMTGDAILAGDRNHTADNIALDFFGDPSGDNPLSHWTVTLGPATNLELRLLQWSFNDFEFVGSEKEPGTVRRIDDSHFRNETGRTFRQAMYVDRDNVYLFQSVPDGSSIDLAAATKKPFRTIAGCRYCSAIGYPAEIANVSFAELMEGRPGTFADSQTQGQDVQPSESQFDLTEMIRAWPAGGGHAFDTRSGIFFGLADEANPPVSLPGKRFTVKGSSIAIVSYERKP